MFYGSLGSFLGVLFYLLILIFAEHLRMNWYFLFSAAIFLALLKPVLKKQYLVIAIVIWLLSAAWISQSFAVGKDEKLLFYREGAYSIVVATEGVANGYPTRTVRTGFHPKTVDSVSILSLGMSSPSPAYLIMCSALALTSEKSSQVLILGSGVGSLGKTVEYFGRKLNRQTQVTQVEINPLVIDVGIKFFDLNSNQVVNSDARKFLQQTQKKYSLIIYNAYQSGVGIPAHLQTAEFISLVNEKLEEDGIFVVNHIINTRTFDGKENQFLQRFLRTLETTFPSENTRLIPSVSFEAPDLKFRQNINTVFLASQRPIDLEKLTALEGTLFYEKVKNLYDQARGPENFQRSGRPFTDQTNNSDLLFQFQ